MQVYDLGTVSLKFWSSLSSTSIPIQEPINLLQVLVKQDPGFKGTHFWLEVCFKGKGTTLVFFYLIPIVNIHVRMFGLDVAFVLAVLYVFS